MQQEIQRRKGVPGLMNSRPIPACDGAGAQSSAASDLQGSPRQQENQGARDRRRRVRRTSSGSVSCRAGIQRDRGIESGNQLRQSERDRRSASGSLAAVRLATPAGPMRRRRSSCGHCSQIRRRRFLRSRESSRDVGAGAGDIARRAQSIWCSFPRSPPSPALMRIMTSPRMIFRRQTMRMDDPNLPPNRRYARPAFRLRSCVPS